ncbi:MULTISPECIES: hypothetical protein [unclassified Polynucleobacter]|uniref:hypothetical protein n=1 Tax=unclassified Polynucleobacter TaxID=2640945 RepID=UPI001F1F6005|nr:MULTISPECIES: hypothetical protein [unclassified Polynucleobacter]MCE7526708.1 hypothetical protein [Polynucleobacter sp. IMCC 30228]MCE7530215.1 hypothetical protein [Polynucleobacter sp. IMCC 29146]
MRQHRLTRLLASLACLLGFFCGGFFVVPNLVLAQPNAAQALSADDLQQINEKPISANAKNTSNTGGKLSHQPAFTHTSSNGTQITEFRDAHSPTSVQVKGALGTYDMSHPSSLMPGAREPATTILSVPSLSLPLK